MEKERLVLVLTGDDLSWTGASAHALPAHVDVRQLSSDELLNLPQVPAVVVVDDMRGRYVDESHWRTTDISTERVAILFRGDDLAWSGASLHRAPADFDLRGCAREDLLNLPRVDAAVIREDMGGRSIHLPTKMQEANGPSLA